MATIQIHSAHCIGTDRANNWTGATVVGERQIVASHKIGHLGEWPGSRSIAAEELRRRAKTKLPLKLRRQPWDYQMVIISQPADHPIDDLSNHLAGIVGTDADLLPIFRK